MPEDFVQVAPDSTGAKVRTRSRTIGANTVEEQFVVVQPEAVVTSRVWLSTLKIPNRTLAAPTSPAVASQPLFSVWNGGATNLVSCRRLSVEIDQLLASAVASPTLRLYRTTVAATGGTVITPVQQYLADTTFNTLVAVRADHQADSVVATTALAQTGVGTQAAWSQTVPRMHTAAGFQVASEYNLLPNDGTLMSQDPLILRPGEGFHIRLEATTALTTLTWTFQVKAVLGEFTYP